MRRNRKYKKWGEKLDFVIINILVAIETLINRLCEINIWEL